MDGGHEVAAIVNAVLNTVQVLFLAWLTARYRNGRNDHG